MKSTGATLIALLLLWPVGFSSAEEKNENRPALLVAVGAGGEKDYDESFGEWAAQWKKAAAASDARVTLIDEADSLDRFRAALEKESQAVAEPLWLVLLGHGTFDGRDAKFNLRGPDLAVSELAMMLKPFTRPVIVIAAFSASGAVLAPLAAPNRIVVTATKSGGENNFARFGRYFSRAIANPAADLDHDGQTSLLEAWLSAARQVAEFYKSEGRLATEHSMLDDNGDGRGTPADWFEGLRVVKKARDNTGPDGLRAHQIHLVPSSAERALPAEVRARRDALELELARLREEKTSLNEEEYFAKLETMLLGLARIYRRAPP